MEQTTSIAWAISSPIAWVPINAVAVEASKIKPFFVYPVKSAISRKCPIASLTTYDYLSVKNEDATPGLSQKDFL